MTDNLWTVKIWRPHTAKYADWFAHDLNSFITETKRDWYGLDFIYVRDYPDSLFWKVFLDCQYETNYLDFMPMEGVQRRIADIQEFYQSKEEWVQERYTREYKYLTKAHMDQFVVDAVKTLMRAYDRLASEIPQSQTILKFLTV